MLNRKRFSNFADMKQNRIIASIFAAIPLLGYAWGQKGHDTVAHIAERHLTETTAAAIDTLLDGKSIVYWANWLDNASHTPEYEYSITWHYKNIDAGQTYDKAKTPKTGDIVSALEQQQLILADTTRTKEERALALKMVVHLYGDLHQPMHMGHKSDKGGNYWKLRWFRNYSNLHKIWDSNLVESGHKWSYTEWADQLDRATEAEAAGILAGGTPEKYARETYGICTAVYEATPEDSNLEYTYIADWTPTVERQLLKGGLRLADALNGLLDSGYTRPDSLNAETEDGE